MAAYVKFESFIEAVYEKKHDFSSDQLTVALLAAANPPSASANAVLADLTEITYTYCSSRNLTVASSSQTGGTYKCVVNDLTLTASGGSVGPFRYVVIYNNTATNDELICYFDRGSELTLADTESVDLDFDGTNGLFTAA